MDTEEILKAIKRLPIAKRFYVIEKTIHSIRTKEAKTQMENAAEILYDEYKTNEELTLLTKLDFEDFYEAR